MFEVVDESQICQARCMFSEQFERGFLDLGVICAAHHRKLLYQVDTAI